MRGLNQHLEFQVRLAGKETRGAGHAGQSGGNLGIPGYVGPVPDNVPDIGTMIPIEHAD